MGQEQGSSLPLRPSSTCYNRGKCVSLEYQPQLITGIHRRWRLLEIDGDHQQGPHGIGVGLFVRSPKQVSVTGIFFSVSIYMVRRCPAFGGVRQFTEGNTKEVMTAFLPLQVKTCWQVKKATWAHIPNPNIWKVKAGESGVQGHCQLQCEFKTSPDHMSLPSQKTKNNKKKLTSRSVLSNINGILYGKNWSGMEWQTAKCIANKDVWV